MYESKKYFPRNTSPIQDAKTGAKVSGKMQYPPYYNFYGSGESKWYIYPDDNWKKEWGRKPFLGTVFADSEFYAIREAVTKGLAPSNFTFGLIALPSKIDEAQYPSRRYNGTPTSVQSVNYSTSNVKG